MKILFIITAAAFSISSLGLRETYAAPRGYSSWEGSKLQDCSRSLESLLDYSVPARSSLKFFSSDDISQFSFLEVEALLNSPNNRLDGSFPMLSREEKYKAFKSAFLGNRLFEKILPLAKNAPPVVQGHSEGDEWIQGIVLSGWHWSESIRIALRFLCRVMHYLDDQVDGPKKDTFSAVGGALIRWSNSEFLSFYSKDLYPFYREALSTLKTLVPFMKAGELERAIKRMNVGGNLFGNPQNYRDHSYYDLNLVLSTLSPQISNLQTRALIENFPSSYRALNVKVVLDAWKALLIHKDPELCVLTIFIYGPLLYLHNDIAERERGELDPKTEVAVQIMADNLQKTVDRLLQLKNERLQYEIPEMLLVIPAFEPVVRETPLKRIYFEMIKKFYERGLLDIHQWNRFKTFYLKNSINQNTSFK